ncbi:FAD-dependent oxidoreductase [Olsenella profusa]|nr:FAD-dependent oxidoreductase [Olsenella profusa]
MPSEVGNLTLKNRVMFPPLTTGYEERDGSIGPRSLAFYERLAKGGVAYIVIGDVAPVNTASPTPKLCDDSQIESFARLADAVHVHGAKLALQIFYPEYDVPGVGRLIMASRMAAMEGQKAQAAGDQETFQAKMAESKEIANQAYAKLHHDMQHFVSEASVEQLAEIRDAIAACAARAERAGVDAIEVHGGRLVGSLCSTALNHRTDDYGGSFENRTRYALEVVAAIREAAPDLMVEYKLPVVTTNPDGSKRGKGGLEPDEACQLAVLLEQAGVDMIQVAQANHTGNMGDTIPPMGTMPYNWTLPVAARVKSLVKVPVATVGRVITPEAARVAAKGGYNVTLYERAGRLGGQIELAAAPPRKSEIMRAVEYYEHELPYLGVDVRLGHAPTTDELNAADAVVVAVGAENVTLPVPGADRDNVASAWDVLAGRVTPTGRVCVIGGGLVGTETAEYLLAHGCQVDIVEMLDKIASGESGTVLPTIMAEFAEKGVGQHVGTRVTAITDEGVQAECTGETVSLPCDWVVMAVGSRAVPFDAAAVTVPVSYVGDCSGERTADIASAVRTAYRVANEL